MNLFIKGITIADPQSEFNGKICDVNVVDGHIADIGTSLTQPNDGQVMDGKGQVLCPGFFDLNCSFGDPGYETKEDINTGTAAAAAGGFTGVALMPNTSPVVHSKAEVEYILNRAKGNLVQVLPIGAISHNLEGKELAEMYDMKQAGAIAFAEAGKAIADDGFMSRALQYASGFDALMILHPENKSLGGKAQVHESSHAMLLGMKGKPAFAEELQITRDIFLAKYHQSRIHIANISTAGAVAIIRKAKQEGVKITCDVAVHQLLFTEQNLSDFDSNYKVNPPLRSDEDRKALIAGLTDGTIDAITTQHRPHEIEFKNVEFEIAKYGMIALQTAVPLLLQAGLSISLIVEKLAIAPRRILGLAVPTLAKGNLANCVAVHPTENWTYNAATNKSRSANSPVLNQELRGKVVFTINHNQVQTFN